MICKKPDSICSMHFSSFLSVCLFLLLFVNSCLLTDPILCPLNLPCSEKEENNSLLLALLGGGGGGSTGHTAPPTLLFSPTAFSFVKDAEISAVTPSITATPLTNCVSTPGLPDGLILSETTCMISGTPTTTQPAASYTITASNAYGSGTTTISIEVTAAGSAPTVHYSGSPFTFSENSAITTITPTLGGNTPTACVSAPALPTGLTLNNTSCAISGTPTETQAATTHTITASNAYGSGAATISITVNAAIVAPTISFSGSPFVFTQNTTISSITPTLTGSTLTNCSASPDLPSGLTLNIITCRISGTPTATQVATNHTITATNSAGSDQAVINIAVNAAGTPPEISYSGSPFTFTQNTAITTITPSLAGDPPTSCTVSPSLPTGLSINATSCAISGTPTATQASTVHTVTASNVYGTDDTTISITVNAIGTAPTISYSGSPFNYEQYDAIATLTPTLGGSTPTGCSASPALPAGLSINPASCVISGAPTATQASTIHSITASNAYGSATTDITVSVNADSAAPAVISSTPANAATAVAPQDGTITIVFNDQMNTSLTPSLTTEAYNGSSYVSIPNTGTTFTWSADKKTLTINISWIWFPENTQLRWTLAAANLKDNSGNAITAAVQRVFTTTSRNTYFPIADTGQTFCYNGSTIIPCGDSSFPNQDGDFSNTPNKRSFTGPMPHPVYANDYTTTDNVTGFTWKTCSQGQLMGGSLDCKGSGTNSPYGATTYTWYNAINACADLNIQNGGAGYAGRTHWRLPTLSELESLPDYGTSNTAKIDNTGFPGAVTSYYWSTSTAVHNQSNAWFVHFSDGYAMHGHSKSTSFFVRCVSLEP
ncbi:MAG: DUF1566 domain-containing protein [Leptonema illini]|uniref:DUF1566 domain-containing protein n=1 Tax=Leptonema illini TaxID=183 RepID=A0A833M0E7_9LEPT|nr:MAG: DUF1566 domain-containing protein [Leptonema illini]